MPRTKVRFGPFELDTRAGELWKGSRRLRLQEKPLKLLLALIEQPTQIVTREELRARLWPPNIVVEFDNGLNNAANKLRAALGDSADAPEYIETVGRRGYRFIKSLEEPLLPAAASNGSAPVAAGRSAPRAVAALGHGHVAPRPRIRSLAVLPLANLSSDPEQEYFSDGMTDALIAQLAGIRSLRIISRQSVMRFKHSTTPMPAIARDLDVDGIIEGTVLRASNRVRISVQLIHGPIDSHLWSAQYERPLDDVLALQAEIAHAVAREVQAVVTPQETARLAWAESIDADAYDLYLRGRYLWTKRSEESLRRALECFKRAVEIEPDFALGYSALAETYGPLGYKGYMAPAEASPKMRAAAERALELDPDLVEALSAFGACLAFHEWQWAEGERQFLRALELNSNYAWTYMWYGVLLENTGRQAENLAARQRGFKLDPLAPPAGAGLGQALFLNGRIDEAVAVLQRSLELDPASPQPLSNLAKIFVTTGRYADAIELFARADDLGGLGHAHAVAGRRSEARAVLAELERRSSERFVSPYDVALVHVGLDHVDAALDALERGYAIRDTGMSGVKVDPRFVPVAGEPRFGSLLERMALSDPR